MIWWLAFLGILTLFVVFGAMIIEWFKAKKAVKRGQLVGADEVGQLRQKLMLDDEGYPIPTFRLLSKCLNEVQNQPVGIVTSVGKRDPETGLTPAWVQVSGLQTVIPDDAGEVLKPDLTKCPDYGKSRWACRKCADLQKCWPKGE